MAIALSHFTLALLVGKRERGGSALPLLCSTGASRELYCKARNATLTRTRTLQKPNIAINPLM